MISHNRAVWIDVLYRSIKFQENDRDSEDEVEYLNRNSSDIVLSDNPSGIKERLSGAYSTVFQLRLKPLFIIFTVFVLLLVDSRPLIAWDGRINKLLDEAISAEVQENFLKAETLYTQALKIADQTQSSIGTIARIYCHLTRVNLTQRKFSEAEKHFNSTVAFATKATRQDYSFEAMVECLQDLADVYERFGNDTRLLLPYKRALEIREKFFTRGHSRVGCLLFKIGRYYLENGYLNESLYFLRRSTTEYKKGPYSEADILHPVLATIAAHVKMGNLTQARDLLKQWIPVVRKAWGTHEVGTAELLQYAGRIEKLDGHFESAEKLFKEAIAISENIGADSPMGYYLVLLAGLYRDQRRFSRAREVYKKAILLLTKTKSKYLFYAWAGLGQLYLMEKNYSKSEHAYREAVRLSKLYQHRERQLFYNVMIELVKVLRQEGKSKEADKLAKEAEAMKDGYDYSLNRALDW